MKQRLQGIFIGVVAMVLMAGAGTVLASASRTVEVVFRDIQLVVNGTPLIPRDGAGNVVEPFIFQGTTYLPVRAVADALGVDVSWDGNTSTVHIGSRDDIPAFGTYTWIDQMSHLNYQPGGGGSLSAWDPGRTVRGGLTFDRGLHFHNEHWRGYPQPKFGVCIKWQLQRF